MDNIENLIRKAEAEIKRDSEDLTRLKRRYPGYDFVLTNPGKTENSPDIQRVPEKEVIFSPLEKTIWQLMDQQPEVEWTSRMMVDAFKMGGLVLPEKDNAAMNAVGAALIRLASEEKIIRTHEGRGRDPHRYVSTRTEIQEETPA